MRRLVALTLAALMLAAPAAAAAASCPKTSLADIEDEVMCPVCGTLLQLSDSPQADRERVFIRRLIVPLLIAKLHGFKRFATTSFS